MWWKYFVGLRVEAATYVVYFSLVYTTQVSSAFGARLLASLKVIIQEDSPENTIIVFVCSPKFCISIVFVFSWDHCKSEQKLETMLMQNLGGQTKSIMVFSKVA